MASMASNCVPVGFLFRPTDEELVRHFLYNKVVAMMNNTPPPQEPLDIPEVDLFDKNQEPWEIWEKLEGPNQTQDLYLFSKLKKANPKGYRIDRKVGKGTWSEGEPAKLVYLGDTGNAIGRKRKFRYENKGNKDHHARWYMDEYSLLADDGNTFMDCVICRLRPNDRSSSSGNNKRSNTSSLCQESDHREKGKKPRISKRKATNVQQVPAVGPADQNDVLDIEKELMALIDFDDDQVAANLEDFQARNVQQVPAVGSAENDRLLDIEKELMALIDFDEDQVVANVEEFQARNVQQEPTVGPADQNDRLLDIEKELMALIDFDEDQVANLALAEPPPLTSN